MFSWTWSVELPMALCELEMFNLAINADSLFYFFKIFEVVNNYMKIMDENCRWRITWKMIFFHIILHPVVLIYDFHIFITLSSSFHGFITNQFNDLQPVGLLAQLVECCTSIAEVKVQILHKPEFFQAFFSHLQRLLLQLWWSSFIQFKIFVPIKGVFWTYINFI